MLPVKSAAASGSIGDAGAEVRRYLVSLPPPTRRRLTQLRAAIRAAAPAAVDGFSYRIPNMRLDGRPLAGWKLHCSLYPIGDAIQKAYAEAIDGYKTSEGTIRFPHDQPLAVTLIKRLVKARMAKSRGKARSGGR
jgi:uncharacterized protein YdhG (YjbR/CyaY superfamily)